MSTRYIKVCLRPKCGAKYSEGSKCYSDDVCECAAPLILKREDVFKVYNVFGVPEEASDDSTIEQSENIKEREEIFVVDHSGGIHFNLKKEEELVNEDRVVIYIGGRVYKEIPLEYDETIFGRASATYKPDIDLTEIDMKRRTSRKHLMIYKQDGKYMARNMTTKNSVHVERTVVREGEDYELEDGNLIILSKSVVMVFRKSA